MELTPKCPLLRPETGIHLSEDQAKNEVVVMTRSIIQCDYDALPEYDPEGVFKHPNFKIGAK